MPAQRQPGELLDGRRLAPLADRHVVALELLRKERRGRQAAVEALERMNHERDRAVDGLGRALRHVRLAAADTTCTPTVRAHLTRAENSIRYGIS